MVDDNRAIFMFKDGSQAWEAKDFLIEQERCKDVTIDNKVYEGKKAAKVGVPSRTLRAHYRLYHRQFMTLSALVVVQYLQIGRSELYSIIFAAIGTAFAVITMLLYW